MSNDLPTSLRGRPFTTTSARRFHATQRERALLRLWRAAPECVSYLRAVVAGGVAYDEGRFKAATALLARCLPTLSAQAVDRTTISTTIAPELVVANLKERLRRIEVPKVDGRVS